MTKEETLKLALEALKYPLNQSHENFNVDMAELLAHRAITAIKEALMSGTDGAQQEQEPRCGAIIEVFGKDWRLDYMSLPVGKHKLYTQQYTYNTPPPVAEPHKRKPLMDEEIHRLDPLPHEMFDQQRIDFARAIEAAHGIKENK